MQNLPLNKKEIRIIDFLINQDFFSILNISKDFMFLFDVNEKLLSLKSEKSFFEKKNNLNSVILFIEKFHSYFHFEQSFIYLLLAHYSYMSNNFLNFEKFIEKSLFQDHKNTIAQIMKQDGVKMSISKILEYNLNYYSEKDFLFFCFKVNIDLNDELKKLEDFLYQVFTLRHYDKDLEFLHHNNKEVLNFHRYLNACSIARFENLFFDEALEFGMKSLQLLESSHLTYHKYSGLLYYLRSILFEKVKEADLSKNDLQKSLNLFPTVLEKFG